MKRGLTYADYWVPTTSPHPPQASLAHQAALGRLGYEQRWEETGIPLEFLTAAQATVLLRRLVNGEALHHPRATAEE